MVIVVDASVLAAALVDEGAGGDAARSRLLGHRVALPEVAELEVVAALLRRRSSGLSEVRARQALTELMDLPLHRVAHRGLLLRCWELAQATTVPDAAYLAAAESLGATLVTPDERLARCPTARCGIDLIG